MKMVCLALCLPTMSTQTTTQSSSLTKLKNLVMWQKILSQVIPLKLMMLKKTKLTKKRNLKKKRKRRLRNQKRNRNKRIKLSMLFIDKTHQNLTLKRMSRMPLRKTKKSR